MAIADALPETEGKPVDDDNGKDREILTTRRRALWQIAALVCFGAGVAYTKRKAVENMFRPSLDKFVKKIGGQVEWCHHGGPLNGINFPQEVHVNTGTEEEALNAQLMTREQLEELLDAMRQEEERIRAVVPDVEPDDAHYPVPDPDPDSVHIGIQALSLRNQTSLDDSTLPSVANVAQFIQLNLVGTSITDAGLEHLSTCSELQYLNLSDTDISIQGVVRLLAHSNLRLKQLDVRGTGITVEQCWKYDAYLHNTVSACITDDGCYPFSTPAGTGTEEAAENQ